NKYMILLMDGVPTFGSVHKANALGYSFNKNKNSYTPPETLDYNGKTYFYVSKSDNYIFWLYYIDTTYSYRCFSSITFVTSDIEIKEEQLPHYNTNYSDGRYAGRGNASEDYLSKGYIAEMAKKLGDIKNSKGEKNLKVYVIGFSNVSDQRAELNFIKDELAKYAKEVTAFEVTDVGGLETVFTGINQIILDDLWHITGPKE
ncbi:MAG: hypothetical protein PHC44_06450, partial [Lutispora sp.]|nr:hypothetical protein [Lutispora sp.]